MKCRESFCDAQVSLTANKCPKCGFDVPKFLRDEVQSEAVGIPIDPVEYWHNWHFFYWWGLDTSTQIIMKERDWVEKGDIIFTLDLMEFKAPFSGVMLSSHGGFVSRSETISPEKDVGYFFDCDEFFQIRPLKSEFIHSIGQVYDPLRDFILRVVEREQGKIWSKLFKSSVKKSIDPKEKFNSVSELTDAAEALRNIKAVNLAGSKYGLIEQRSSL